MNQRILRKSFVIGLFATGWIAAGLLGGCGAASDDNDPYAAGVIATPTPTPIPSPAASPTDSIGITSFRVSDPLPGDLEESVTAAGVVSTAGGTGTGTFSVTGLPDGVTAVIDPATITLPAPAGTVPVQVTLTTKKNLFTGGTYPIRLVLTANGKTYTSAPTNLVVQPVNAF